MTVPGSAPSSVWIDRIEGDRAVLGTDGDLVLEIPTTLLPPGASEGTWLKLSLEVDAARTAEETKNVEALLDRLGASDDGGDLIL